MAKFCASGLSGPISGAKTAITTQAPTTATPTAASGWRHGPGTRSQRRRRSCLGGEARGGRGQRKVRGERQLRHDSLIRGSMTP